MILEIPGCDEVSFREAKGSLRGLRVAIITRLRGVLSVNGFGEPWDLVRSRSRDTWYAAAQASRQPPRNGAYRTKPAMRIAQRHHDPAISQHRKIIPQQIHIKHMSRGTWYAAGQTSRQPPGNGASKMKLAMSTRKFYLTLLQNHTSTVSNS